MSLQISITHRLGNIKCTLQWSLRGHQHVCISCSQEDIKRQLKKTSNEINFQLNQYLSDKPIPVLNLQGHFKYFFVPFNWYVRHKASTLVLGPHGEDRKHYMNKTKIGNPKVSRGSPSVTYISADCGPLVQHIRLGCNHTGDFKTTC